MTGRVGRDARGRLNKWLKNMYNDVKIFRVGEVNEAKRRKMAGKPAGEAVGIKFGRDL